MDVHIFYLCICLSLCAGVTGDEATLYTDLGLESTGSYNADVRPRILHTDVVNVTLDFEIHAIRDMDEVSQVFSVVGFIIATWQDDYLTWDPASYNGLDRLIVPASTIWTPDFGVVNSADAFYDSSYRDDFHASITSDGEIQWGFGGIISVRCVLDLTYYPFDSHACPLELENFMYDSTQVELTNYTDHIVSTDLHQHGIWQLTNSLIEKTYIHYAVNEGLQYPKLSFVMHLNRKSDYYIINFIVPTIFMVVLALSVFWLPCESGEKIGLGITVMLTFSVFQLTLTSITPSNSEYTPVLTIVFLFCMGISAASLLTTIWVLYVNHIVAGRAPRWLRNLMFNYLARFICMRSSTPTVEEPTNKVMADNSSKAGSAVKINVAPVDNKENTETREYTDQEEWQAIARLMDRTFFWIFSITATFGLLGLLVQAAEWERTVVL